MTNNITGLNGTGNGGNTLSMRDLIELYLREIDTLQHSIDTLENRVSCDLIRIETDLRQFNLTNDDNFRELRENCAANLEEISNLRDNISNIKDLIHNIELTSCTTDIKHGNRIENLELKVAFYSIVTTIVSVLGIEGFTKLLDFLRDIIK